MPDAEWLRQLTKKEVATALGVGERTVERLVEKGHLAPPRKAQGNPVWYFGDLEVYRWRLLRGELEGDPTQDPDNKDD